MIGGGSSLSRQMRCPKCKTKEILGTFPNYECIKCGEKFQEYKGKSIDGVMQQPKRTHKEVVSLTLCPNCGHDKIEKKEKYAVCKSCNYFDMIETFEAV